MPNVTATAICVLCLTGVAYSQSQLPGVHTYTPERPIDQGLFSAVRDGNVERVRKLLAGDADANANEANGWRPLISMEAPSADELAIVKLLLAHGAHVNYRQPDQGWTPLTWALNHGASQSVVDLLLSKGADVRAAMKDGMTALHFAVMSGNIQTARELIARGASLSARTCETPRPPANLGGKADPEEAKERADLQAEVARYYEPGFHQSGKTPAFEVNGGFGTAMAKYLVSAGADFKAVDDNGWTILHWKVKEGLHGAIMWLLGIGLNPNAQSKAGYTPLHVAMSVGFSVPDDEAVRLLLKAGADPRIRNKSGQTPLELLRADVAANLRVFKASASDAYSVRRYLRMANQVAKLLDPKTAPIVAR